MCRATCGGGQLDVAQIGALTGTPVHARSIVSGAGLAGINGPWRRLRCRSSGRQAWIVAAGAACNGISAADGPVFGWGECPVADVSAGCTTFPTYWQGPKSRGTA
ncbi:hypothetical protein BC2230_30390 [Burkholderia cepacia]